MVVESIPNSVGFIYALLAFAALAWLWRSGRFTRRRAVPFLVVSVLLGFLVFAPVFPYQLQAVVLRDAAALGAPLPAALVGTLAFIVLTLVVGRIICGQICPVGAVQELMHLVPTKKRGNSDSRVPTAVRAGVFVVFLAAGLGLGINLLGLIGLADFFNLTVASVSFFVFLSIVLLSAVVYRPFCRYVCPYGALLAPAASRALYRLRRTDACIGCRKCERACPTGAARPDDRLGECYLCGRCTEACPVDGALVYTRGEK
ncbi:MULTISPECIES: 4Fe-4S binding protein [unclassified Methanoculleus]|uniref:4Fe-4S binding protein n=1 Tax=unclassified Methanoculleus TaxID=2619537 RepID=UPI0025ECE257|nr:MULTISPECIES: 4Fe-4S binding protein [unclassified Methanoculleus]MCK9319467.1 4Fe-4S binding protein [Methanoculleus sp.]MDD2254571.1 4Fe-4S binding protein [Methanoculleus sp.]MDD2788525.1 4Fe-4S binding protein [Methanoculleus sp.]MDD3216930.1 4Fe-4S binding protein [Methanoculleus sp.]MDD4314938.1 4Fe-4S binding protein [Methanoculleus sp.]